MKKDKQAKRVKECKHEWKYWKLRDWFRFLARLLYLPFILLKDFVEFDKFPTWRGLKDYLFHDYLNSKYLAQRKAGW